MTHRTPRVLAGLALVFALVACDEGPFLVSGVQIGNVALSETSLSLAAEETDSVSIDVFDEEGVAVEGQVATWISEDPSVASVTGGPTGAEIAAVGEGTTRVQVTVGGVSAFVDVDVIATAFDIELRYVDTTPTAAQEEAFDAAVAYWRRAVVGDLSDFSADIAAGECGGVTAPAVNEVVDDLLIFVEFTDIDGQGGTLGQASPCWLRSSDGTPFMGGMIFDNADLGNLGNLLGPTIRHEMAHVLGVGSLWDFAGFTAEPSDTSAAGSLGADTHFTGPLAIAAFNTVGGTGYPGAKVPVENDQDNWGAGSLDVHWRESVFNTELMTPGIDVGSNPSSLVTIQSLADLGYQVNTGAADPYQLPPVTALAKGQAVKGASIQLVNDVAPGPIGVMDPDGRVVGWVFPGRRANR